MIWKRIGWLVLVGTAVFFLAACQSETIENGSSPSVSTAEKLKYTGPKPEKGTSNVYGKITWNGAPAEGLDMLLCQDFSSFSGCQGQEYAVQTQADGSYTFANVVPGTYALSVRVFDSDDWLYVTSGILSAADYEVVVGETLIVESQSIFKLDLELLKPNQDAELKSGERTFQWQAYESAAYYQIYLTPFEGDAIFVNEKVDGTEIKASLPPINCEYRWSLEAFNANGIKIAETSDYWEFTVGGEESSCHLTIEAPEDGAAVDAQGMILAWTTHPDAAVYKILMWDDSVEDRPHILDFYEVQESRFAFNGDLTPGHRYVWSVYAYDADGNEIAASEIHDFTVTP
ncbi:MAG: hypothetical protein H6667_11560 [Ardenticatenaceae bacterium]|nr:hypothetical protein [Ardenticatenaceae bacterium]MCB9446376.1 hypothetical protein [Ardenticatenaceae bacterium]